MEWFTSDPHFGHANIIIHCNRPFRDINSMDAQLIMNWNGVVDHEDTVYVLGDFTLKHSARMYFSQLKGKIFIVPGCHDYWLDHNTTGLYSLSEHPITILPPLYNLRLNGYTAVLCHYALRVWYKSHYGSYQLHGHSHGRLPPVGRQYDVGVDHNEFYPITFESIRDKIGRH